MKNKNKNNTLCVKIAISVATASINKGSVSHSTIKTPQNILF